MEILRGRNTVLAGAVAALVAACGFGAPAAAQWSLSLPVFSACTPAQPATLPERWRAVGLLSPFALGQIDVGEFVYDGSLPAMRATVYGLESGAADLLITGNETWQLSGPHAAPTGCVSLGRKFAPPSAQWLAQPLCVGEAPLGQSPMQWWKAAASDKRADWLWLRKETRLPWRTLFAAPKADPAVIGDYAMSYFPEFAAVENTSLAKLRDFCVAKAAVLRDPATAAAKTARMLMANRNAAAEAEREARIASLIPGLSHKACAGTKISQWPDGFVMSAILTGTSFKEQPYSTLIYYDWNDTVSQLAMMFQDQPPDLKGFVLLKKGVGYRIEKHANGGFTCQEAFPGTVRPDWRTRASCSCKGVIENNPALSPGEATQILACPIKAQAPRVMWTWYTGKGRPVVFAEAAAVGGGLMLADYHSWLPGQKAPAKDLALPPICTAQAAAPGKSGGHKNLGNVSCSDCHTMAR